MKRIKTGSLVKIIDTNYIHNWSSYYSNVTQKNRDECLFRDKDDIEIDLSEKYLVIQVVKDLYMIRQLKKFDDNEYYYAWGIDRKGIIHADDYEENTPIIEDDITTLNSEVFIDEITNKINDSLSSSLNKINETLDKKSHLEEALIEGIVDKGKELAVEDIKNKLLQDCDKYIEEHYGILPKIIKFEDNNKPIKEMKGIFHKKFEDICRIVRKDIPLMLTGPAGAGKNYTLEQVAKALELDFYFTNSITQEYKLTGFIDANGVYHETEFYKAFTKGGLFFLDEVDASIPEALIILNSAIANRYFDFPIGRVEAHKNFRVVCAGNTYGTGADMLYVGRNVLDGATLDRFVVVEFDYDNEVERQLSYDEELYNFIHELRETINKCSLRYIVSMRALINASKLLEIGIDKSTILKTAIIKNMQIDDLNTIINKFINTSSEWYQELKKMV